MTVDIRQLEASIIERTHIEVTSKAALESVEHDLSGLLLQRAIGHKVDLLALEDLERRRTELNQTIEQENRTLIALREQVTNWSAGERERQRVSALEDLAILSKESADLKAEYLDIMTQYGDVLNRMHDNRRQWEEAARRHQAADHVYGHGYDRPVAPYVVPVHLEQTGPKPGEAPLGEQASEWLNRLETMRHRTEAEQRHEDKVRAESEKSEQAHKSKLARLAAQLMPGQAIQQL